MVTVRYAAVANAADGNAVGRQFMLVVVVAAIELNDEVVGAMKADNGRTILQCDLIYLNSQ